MLVVLTTMGPLREKRTSWRIIPQNPAEEKDVKFFAILRAEVFFCFGVEEAYSFSLLRGGVSCFHA